tara:strand:+ start:191 stop:502 length:312 start_codon:yes stop_codon:yes gene_type:complete
MIQRVGNKYKGAQGWLGNKVKNVMRQGQKVMNKPIVKGALMIGAAVGGAALASGGRENKQLTQLQSNTNINNTGVGADYFKIPNAPSVKPFTEEAFPTMVFRE